MISMASQLLPQFIPYTLLYPSQPRVSYMYMYMLQVKSNLRSICSNLGQSVST